MLRPISATDLLVQIYFADDLPNSAEADAMSNVFFRLDLDMNTATGSEVDELGIDLGIKLQGFDSSQPWVARIKTHNELAERYGFVVKDLQYADRTLTFLLQMNGSQHLDQFGLQIGAMHDYDSVDRLPNQGPLYIEM